MVVPPAVDNLSLSLPELPIPSAAPSRAADRGDGNSFQNALARAGSASNDASRTDAPDRSATPSSQGPQAQDQSRASDSSQPSDQAAEKQSPATSAKESQASDQGKPDDADDVDQGTPPVVTDEKKDGDSDHEEEQTPDQAALALAALAAAQAQAKAPVAQTDEVALSDTAKEQALEPVAAAKPVGVKTDVPAATPVTSNSPKITDEATPTTATAATEQVIVAEIATNAAPVVNDVQPNTDTKPKTVSAESTTVAEEAKGINLGQETSPTEKSLAAVSAEQTTAAPVAAATVAVSEQESSTDKRADRSDDKTTAKDAGVGATTAAAADLPAAPQVTSDTVQTPDVTIAAAVSIPSGEKAAPSDAAGDTPRKDSGRQPDITGIRHPASGAEAPRNSNSRTAAATFGALGEQAGAGGLSQGDRVRLVQRVARAVQTAQERGGDLQLRLSPPELGSLRLQVKMTDGALSARLEAETPQAQQVLMDSLPQLRERLADQNIRVERFDVDLMQSGGGGPSNLPDRRQDASQDGSSSRGSSTVRRQAGNETAVGGPSPTRFVAAGRLDIVA
ncbi:MAG: hypothetical protein C0483_20935 [Pirellula sp.]|nr:hypothetical protein [Pirellula sp.]